MPGIAPEQTGLTGPSYHTGTLTVLRVDDAWHSDPQKRQQYTVGGGLIIERGRFVPLRGKTDISGLDGPERVVTKDDLVTITLNSAFIKYFREFGGRTATGEVAVVLSFSAGTSVQESLLVHSSRGQTYGSFLDLQDWPVIGPIQIDGDSLLVRLVIIELDQTENESLRQTVRALAGIGTAVSPNLGPIFDISQQIADFVITQNSDDVIFDQKFSLQRVDSSLPITRSPLLYGKYVLLMQEDKYVSREVGEIAPLSTLPPEVDHIRYDLEFDRIATVYNYFPNPNITQDECDDGAEIDVAADFRPTFGGSLYEGVGRIDYSSFFPQPDGISVAVNKDMRPCVLKILVNGDFAKNLRASQLGYRDTVVGELELYGSLDKALKTAYLDGVRHFPSAPNEVTQFQSQLRDIFGDLVPTGEVPFNYVVTQYPEAFTLVAQYPIHTHLVFSIDRSLGGGGKKFHERFQTIVDFMNSELQSTRDNDRIGALATTLNQMVRSRKNQRALLRKIDRLQPEPGEATDQFTLRRVCHLWVDGLRPNTLSGEPTPSLSDAPVYNEIFHIIGKSLADRGEVASYLEQNGWLVNRGQHTCAPPTSPNESAQEAG